MTPYLLALNRRIGLEAFRWLATADPPAAVLLPAKADSDAREAATEAQQRGFTVMVCDQALRAEPQRAIADTGAEALLSVHFPEMLPPRWLDALPAGCLNLHPSLLPWGRGWNTSTWALIEGSAYGATLHYMTPDLDAGDIVAQQPIDVRPEDTAHVLYERVLDAELELLRWAWPEWRAGRLPRRAQSGEGSLHRRGDLDASGLRRLDLDALFTGRDLLTRLRAFTTDRWSEAAWFEERGRRYAVRVEIRPIDEGQR